jgi:hypothetical protein
MSSSTTTVTSDAFGDVIGVTVVLLVVLVLVGRGVDAFFKKRLSS